MPDFATVPADVVSADETYLRHTYGRLPVELVWFEEHADKAEAMRREWAVKRLTRAQKLALIAERSHR